MGQTLVNDTRNWRCFAQVHACVIPRGPTGSLQHCRSSCHVFPGWRGIMEGRASGSLHSCWVSIALFHKQSDLYFDSAHALFSKTPVSISDSPLHPSSHCITVLSSTICCKKLCRRDKIFKDIKEEGCQQHFSPTAFVTWKPDTSQPRRTLQALFV